MVADLGGLFIVLYILFSAINSVLTWRKFENYLVSELHHERLTTNDDFNKKKEPFDNPKTEIVSDTDHVDDAQENVALGKGKNTKLRRLVDKEFDNEILESDDEVLDPSKISKCGCFCRNNRLGRIFKRGREITAQELNVARIVGSIRMNREHLSEGENFEKASCK